MQIIISPAKKLDFKQEVNTGLEPTYPVYHQEADYLISILRQYSVDELKALMNISDDIARLNADRYLNWQTPFTKQNAKEALPAFKGDVYRKIDLSSFLKADFQFAQDHLMILSGLFGVLRPLDLIQPYRLEMGTKLPTKKGKDLYAFWNGKISDFVYQRLQNDQDGILINLASNEYFKSLDEKNINARIIKPVFKEFKNGQYKIISIYAKEARGMMTDYLVRNRISNPDQIKLFQEGGYQYDENLSEGDQWVFTR